MPPLPWPIFRYWKAVPAFSWLFAVAVLLFLTCCRPRSKDASPINRSFYYWKSIFSLTERERQSLRALGVEQLYVRFFDVTWDERRGQATPAAAIRFNDSSYLNYTIVPVVFISNEVFTRLDATGVDSLAGNITRLVAQLRVDNRLAQPRELQLDCDWTAATRDRYFGLLKNIRQRLNTQGQQTCQLSATIRLYQCKYPAVTGVPPVDKGLLMCYNMGNLKSNMARNSILETTELEKYTSHLSSYPLPLNVALPVFDWKVYFHEGRYAGLVESLPTACLSNRAVMKSGNLYTFKRDTSLKGYHFEKGDQLRDEHSDYNTLQAAAHVVARQLKSPPCTVLLFHLDPTNLANYTTDELENLFTDFD
jgi:hypothetical protein